MSGLPDWIVVAAWCVLALALAAMARRGAAFATRRRDAAKAEAAHRAWLDEEISVRTAWNDAARDSELESWSQFRRFVVDRIEDEAVDIRSFYLAPLDGRPLPQYLPGQHITLQVTPPGAPRPVVRCYTLSRPAGDPAAYRISVSRAVPPGDMPDAPPGRMSGHLFAAMRPGSQLEVKAPGGRFVAPPPGPRPLVLIAGGIGITPMLAMLESCIARGDQRPIWLFYGVRDGRRHAFRTRIAELVAATPHLTVVTAYSQPRAEDAEGRDHDCTGRLDAAAILRTVGTTDAIVCICATPAMTEAMRQGLEEGGVAASDIHSEAFGAAGARVRAPAAGHCTVRFARSGLVASWRPEAGTLLDLAEAEGVPLASGCRAGQCGTCAVSVLEGGVEHIGAVDAPPHGRWLACLAAPTTDVVVDA